MDGEVQVMRVRSALVAVAGSLAVVAGAALPAAAEPATGAAPLIVGGQDATENYGWMASQQNATTPHNCGASLVADQWLVTAAHCVDGEKAADWQYRIGTSTRSAGGEVAQAERFVVHPRYAAGQGSGDIALVKLVRPVSAQPLPIANGSPWAGTPVREIGWGQTCPERGCTPETPDKLQQLDTTVAPDSGCSAAPDVGYDSRTELCMDNRNGSANACYGDSGGPAVMRAGDRWVLAGATSRGQTANCTEKPGIYTDVTAYRGWIDNTIATGSDRA